MDKTNTPDEVVDVVNENDQVIGQSTKGEVNSNPKLWHREIAVLIFDNKGRVLVQQRSRNKKNSPFVWTLSVAGHVPTGMTYEEAAHMELKEELGFDTKLVSYEKLIFYLNTETQVVTSFIGRFPENTKVLINRDEIESYKFVNLVELEILNKVEKVEESSLEDFRKFFGGEYDKFTEQL